VIVSWTSPTAEPTSPARKPHAAQLRNSITPEKFEERNGPSVFLDLWEVPMTSQAKEGACAFAWRNYLLRYSSISENDSRRSALYRYVTNLRDTSEYDFDLLQIAAVAYLKKLDELHDDRGRDSRQIKLWPSV
jgi:hypothetical protein